MRIVLIHTQWGYGGTERQVAWLTNALHDRGHEVSVLTMLAAPAEAPTPDEWPGVGFTKGPHLLARGVPPALRRIAALEADVVIAFLFHSTMLVRLASVVSRPQWRQVSSIRSTTFGSPTRDWLWAATARLDDAVCANFSNAASALGLRRAVTHIPNALSDLPDAPEAGRSDDRRVEIVAVGSLRAAKRPLLMIEAVREAAAQSDRRLCLTLVGDGPMRHEVLDAIDRGPPEPEIRWLPRLEHVDVMRQMAAADVMVAASAWEGSPNVLLEAMAMGLPYVATDVAGACELHQLAGGESGLIVPVESSPAQLGEAIVTMMASLPSYREAARRTTKVVRRAHSSGAVADAWNELLVEVVGANHE